MSTFTFTFVLIISTFLFYFYFDLLIDSLLSVSMVLTTTISDRQRDLEPFLDNRSLANCLTVDAIVLR